VFSSLLDGFKTVKESNMGNLTKNPVKNSWRSNLRSFWRRHLKPFLKDYQWFIIGALWLVSFGLGYVGVTKVAKEKRPIWDTCYRSLQLFIMEDGMVVSEHETDEKNKQNPNIEGDKTTSNRDFPLEFEASRFLSPVVAASTVVATLLVVFHERLLVFLLRLRKNHVVICGLGRKGLLLTKGFIERGDQVVVIEQEQDNDLLDLCRDLGAIVIIGNATDSDLLGTARVHRAKYLISVCGNDGINAEIAVHAHEMVKHRKGKGLTCFIHISNPELCSLLEQRHLEIKNVNSFNIRFFNVFESGARALLREYPAFSETQNAQTTRPHLLVVGVGKMGESLIVHAARSWQIIYKKSGIQMRITIIDKKAGQKKESLCLQYPKLEKICDLIAIQTDIQSPEFQRGRFLFDSNNNPDVTIIYVCLDDDSFGLTVGLTLLQKTRRHNIPIVVRMTQDAGLAKLLHEVSGSSNRFENIHAFGVLNQLCKPDLLFSDTYELIARVIHEDYVRHQKEKGESSQTNPSMVSWDELPENLKESNRQQARHIGAKLKAVNCDIEQLTDWEAELFEFTQEEVELLAEKEHERWVKERLDDGWKPGPVKIVENKVSPYLVPYDELPDEIKEYDRNTVRGLPSFLAKVGLQICRLNSDIKNNKRNS